MGIFKEFLLAGLVLSINLVATIIYLFYLTNEARKRRFFSMPVVWQKSLVLFFVGPLFVSPFVPQARMNIGINDFIIIPAGLLLVIGGLVFIGFAFLKIGVVPSLKEKANLIKQGIYRIIRHPIYGGTIFTCLGLIILENALISLLYFPISVMLYFIMTVYEEKSLINEYGQDYIEYQKLVRKRIIPWVL